MARSGTASVHRRHAPHRHGTAAKLGRMPELPDVTVYIEALERRVVGQPLRRVKLLNPFILRTAVPPISSAEGKRVTAIRRVGKRIVLVLEGPLYLVMHLMIAGRLRWAAPGKKPPNTLVLLEFDDGSLAFTEAGTKRRASLHLLSTLEGLDPGGAEIFDVSADEFVKRLRGGNHTLKRALTDPHLFSGIGNAYSDEILHRAKLSPILLTSKISDEEARRLYEATRTVMREWIERLRAEAAGNFPEKVTAFREGMAVHGRYGKPCPVCGSPVQRIVFAENETNYCARCQTGGKILADRALSRLLKKSWPRTLEELE
jgi:formamidopyrimidine-DNA glycosylase